MTTRAEGRQVGEKKLRKKGKKRINGRREDKLLSGFANVLFGVSTGLLRVFATIGRLNYNKSIILSLRSGLSAQMMKEKVNERNRINEDIKGGKKSKTQKDIAAEENKNQLKNIRNQTRKFYSSWVRYFSSSASTNFIVTLFHL
jgi:hypothetical protein